jgi:hypothetical protein
LWYCRAGVPEGSRTEDGDVGVGDMSSSFAVAIPVLARAGVIRVLAKRPGTEEVWELGGSYKNLDFGVKIKYCYESECM